MKQREVWRGLSEQFSLIRLNGKVPVEREWQAYCHKKRDFNDIGFRPGDNAGIACGPASGVLVLDIDDQELFEKTCRKKKWGCPASRTHETGSGKYHVLYKYPAERVYGNKSHKDMGFDIRGVGGQIVAPGSIHPDTGKPYTVLNEDEISDPPEWLLSLYSQNGNGNPDHHDGIKPELILAGVKQGERDEMLFKYACRLRQQGVGILEAKILLETAARQCDPPFSVRVALSKVDQVYARYEEGQCTTLGDSGGQWGFEGTDGGQWGDNLGDNGGDNEGDKSCKQTSEGLAAIVETYLKNFTGNFSTKDMTEYIQSKAGVCKLDRPHQKALAKILARHVDAKRLERTVRGGYRIVDSTLEDLDEGEGETEHSIKLPLLLNQMVYIEPKEVILVCGNSDGGKTAFAINVALLNKKHIYNKEVQGAGGFGVYHFVSEMGGVSFRNKISVLGGDGFYEEYRKQVRVLRFKPDSIADQIQPNSINVIDYLEPPKGDFREVVPAINDIFDKLETGVAVVCIQMRGESPVGGTGVFWKPRLALALINDKKRNCKMAQIIKGKNHRNECSIDGWELDYWVMNKGTTFRTLTEWESPYGRHRKAYTNY